MAAKWIAAAVLALVLVGAGTTAVLSYRNMATKVAELEPLKQQVADLDRNYQTLSREVVKRAEFDSALRQQRITTNTRIDDAAKHDPAVSAYLSERIPDGLRRAYADSPKR